MDNTQSFSNSSRTNSSETRAQILVCYHKPSTTLKSRFLCPIQVGRETSSELLDGMIGDNTGNNISSRNASYCELTAIYWAWKNLDAEYYGLMHYRRIFDFTGDFKSTECYSLNQSEQAGLGLDDVTILSALNDCDVVLPTKVDLPLVLKSDSVEAQYCQEHCEKDLQQLRIAVEATAPETVEDFDAVMSGRSAYFYNMFVMRKELFHGYAEWLFSILFEVESRIDLNHHAPYQKRVFGFMAERLLTVYIHHCQRVQEIRIKELPVVFVSDSPPGFVKRFQAARQRLVRFKIRKGSVHLKLLQWEHHYGKTG